MPKTKTENNEVAPHHYSAAIVVVVISIAVLVGLALMLWQENRNATVSGTNNTTTTNVVSNNMTNTPSKTTTNTSNTTNSTSNNTSSTSNKYNGLTVKVGDKVAGMTVTHKEGSLSDPAAPVSKDVILVHFAGQTTVSGTYNYSKNEMTGSYELVFTVNNSDLSKIPYMNEKEAATKAFRIENTVYAFPLLGITYGKDKTGSAKIVIDSFYDAFVGAEVAPTASLVEVVK